jgi:hypothetical protein
MTGGNGLLSLDATGTIIDSTGNFLIRSANLFLHHGLNVMMADALPAHPSGLDNATRLSATHAAELQGFINAALTRWNKPVWVVGTSNGSVSTVTAGGFQPALSGLTGVVMTSPVTVLPSGSQPTFNLYASRLWSSGRAMTTALLVRRPALQICSRSSLPTTKRAVLSSLRIRWLLTHAAHSQSTAMPASRKKPCGRLQHSSSARDD